MAVIHACVCVFRVFVFPVWCAWFTSVVFYYVQSWVRACAVPLDVVLREERGVMLASVDAPH